jgi:enhancer of polycomb-like protein
MYQKIAVIRHSSDSLTYDDSDGNSKSVSVQQLGDAIATATPLVLPKTKLDIPVPRINNVESYERDVPATYQKPISYVRCHRPSRAELKAMVEYVADREDQEWLTNNTKFGGAVVWDEGLDTLQQRKPQLPLALLERILDLFEKETGFDAIMTSNQAEAMVFKNIPLIYQIFPNKPRNGVVTTKTVLLEVYNYWLHKRSKLKRPLLRRFWPVTSSDDTNPHLVFRPREKEKYKLRKKRQNDMDAYRKMKQLRNDSDNLRAVLELVRRREELARAHIKTQMELFEQRMYDIVDTTGLPRELKHVDKDQLKRVLDTPSFFDIYYGGRKKQTARSPVFPSDITAREARPLLSKTLHDNASSASQETPAIVAGQNSGEPAPLFLDPLQTRETYATSWQNAVPHVTSYIESHAEPTFRFRHRPRVGRGGRLCIDRMPRPPNPTGPTTTVVTAGRGMPQSLTHKDRLLDLLPKPLDHISLSRKIESMSVEAIKEDQEANVLAAATNGDLDENDADEVLVKLDDWLETDDQPWGNERFAIGPL